MSTNAPYYQMRAGQLSTGTNSSPAPVQTGLPQDDSYFLTAGSAIEVPTQNQHLPSYPEHAKSDGHFNTSEENHNLVELLEAATTAADQAPHATTLDETSSIASVPESKSKKKRASSPTANAVTTNEAPTQSHASTSKRRRVNTSTTDPSLQIQFTNNDTATRSPKSHVSPSPPRELLNDARAAGVHSAAALFRRSSSNATRKYTRPPMSKLFMSLNITPENFIALQALAKAYMLSPAHPERQSCVGNRGKGDTDMVKLRLFNCVRDFLADGVGEQFFGENVQKLGQKENSEAPAALGQQEGGAERLVWPRDGNKIISLVTPLMRRMVTNERQRLYAIDTRKGGKKAEKEGSAEAPSTPASDAEQQLCTTLDPDLQTRLSVQTSPPVAPATTAPQLSPPTSIVPPTSISVPTSPVTPINAAEPHLTHINIFLTYVPSNAKQSIKLDEKRISTTRPAHLTFYNYNAFIEQVAVMIDRAKLLHPSIKVPATGQDTESLRDLAAAANALQPDKDKDKDEQQSQASTSTPLPTSSVRYTVKTIGPSGWHVIDSAEQWYHILTERAFALWADGVCNVIVELNGAQGQLGVGKIDGIDGAVDGEVQMKDI